MLKDLVYSWLVRKRNKKQHEVMQLRWRKAEIERLLDQKKKERLDGKI